MQKNPYLQGSFSDSSSARRRTVLMPHRESETPPVPLYADNYSTVVTTIDVETPTASYVRAQP